MRVLVCMMLALACTWASADTQVGLHVPFYLSHKGSGAGGAGIHVSKTAGAWEYSFDRLQNVVRNDGIIDRQHFVSVVRRFQVKRVDLFAGVAIGERSTAIGSVGSFKIGGDMTFGKYRVGIHHWSNGGLNGPNWAYNTLVISRSL